MGGLCATGSSVARNVSIPTLLRSCPVPTLRRLRTQSDSPKGDTR